MNYDEWEPFYTEIRGEFGFSKEADEQAARVLADVCRDKVRCDRHCLEEAIQKKVSICGFGPNLEKDLERTELEGTVIAADGATKVLMDFRIRPHVIVTDLDGDLPSQISANREGSIAVILAHGDNLEAIREVVPLFRGPITPTTQGRPFDDVEDFGGFTDGDRAVILARHFGASQILLLGFDFENPRKKESKDQHVKLRKLRWAKRLIFELNPPEVRLLIP
jgi:hypothetical protein